MCSLPVSGVPKTAEPSLIEGAELQSLVTQILLVVPDLVMVLPRPMLERFVERLIERLDEWDGDIDLEDVDERELEFY